MGIDSGTARFSRGCDRGCSFGWTAWFSIAYAWSCPFQSQSRGWQVASMAYRMEYSVGSWWQNERQLSTSSIPQWSPSPEFTSDLAPHLSIFTLHCARTASLYAVTWSNHYLRIAFPCFVCTLAIAFRHPRAILLLSRAVPCLAYFFYYFIIYVPILPIYLTIEPRET